MTTVVKRTVGQVREPPLHVRALDLSAFPEVGDLVEDDDVVRHKSHEFVVARGIERARSSDDVYSDKNGVSWERSGEGKIVILELGGPHRW